MGFRIGKIEGAVGDQKLVIVKEGDDLVYYAHELTRNIRNHKDIADKFRLSEPLGGRIIGYDGAGFEDLLIVGGSTSYGGVPDKILVPNKELILSAYQEMDPRVKRLWISEGDSNNIVWENKWRGLL
jgi:hypothetical protein